MSDIGLKDKGTLAVSSGELERMVAGYLDTAGWLVVFSYLPEHHTCGWLGRGQPNCITIADMCWVMLDRRKGPFVDEAYDIAKQNIIDVLDLVTVDDVESYLDCQSLEDFGRDVWLTTNDHNIGFWGRKGLTSSLENLSTACTSVGVGYSFVNSDNKVEVVYFTPLVQPPC